jgi:hypothetical protein
VYGSEVCVRPGMWMEGKTVSVCYVPRPDSQSTSYSGYKSRRMRNGDRELQGIQGGRARVRVHRRSFRDGGT